MTLKELKSLCEQMETEGYRDSDLVMKLDFPSSYEPMKFIMKPNEYGDLIVEINLISIL